MISNSLPLPFHEVCCQSRECRSHSNTVFVISVSLSLRCFDCEFRSCSSVLAALP
ncbi:UNVERIFIED_CONTAM: hypothetical protein FKN15_063736 [Acipenser sinensis]